MDLVLKWNNMIDCWYGCTGPEYGTTQAAWKGVLVEADRLSDLHLQIKNHLSEDVPNQVKSWQKDNYHKVWQRFSHLILERFNVAFIQDVSCGALSEYFKDHEIKPEELWKSPRNFQFDQTFKNSWRDSILWRLEGFSSREIFWDSSLKYWNI